MMAVDQIDNMVHDNNGIITTRQVESIGISRPVFYKYIKDNGLDKISRGIYATKDAWLDESYILSLRCPLIIYSHEEALFLHGLSDREPLIHTVTVKTGYNPSHLYDDCKVYTIKKDLYEMGKTEIKDSFGNLLPVYNLERTICDVIRSRNNIEIHDFQNALRGYVRRKDKNTVQLMEYAKKLRVERLVRQYLEVLL